MLKPLLDAIFSLLLTHYSFDDPVVISEMIRSYSAKYQLRPEVVAAIIWQESRGNIWASRPEPAFFQRYLKDKKRKELVGHVPKGTPILSGEKRLRSISWGLMQVMGETARMMGFKKRYLPSLCLPSSNLNIGCKYLRYLLDKYSDLEENEAYKKALLRYNGGGDPDYPNTVLGHIDSGAYKKVLI